MTAHVRDFSSSSQIRPDPPVVNCLPACRLPVHGSIFPRTVRVRFHCSDGQFRTENKKSWRAFLVLFCFLSFSVRNCPSLQWKRTRTVRAKMGAVDWKEAGRQTVHETIVRCRVYCRLHDTSLRTILMMKGAKRRRRRRCLFHTHAACCSCHTR